MLRKYVILLSTITVLSVLTIIIILSAADIPNKKNNGFVRKNNYRLEQPDVMMNIGDFVTKISGATKYGIYFSGNNPGWLLKLDYSLHTIDTMGYGLLESEKLRAPGITIDSPNLYMYAPEISYLIKGNVDSTRVDTLKLHSELITRTAQISTQKLAVKAIDSTKTKQVFKIIDCQTGEVIKEKDLIASQQFGGFDKDGFFKYDKETQKLYFILMFENLIFCLDTNLNVVYKARTIDTTFTNQVSTAIVTENGSTKIMATTPRVVVNRQFEVANNHIYNVSGLRADNENLKEFNKIFPIDIYRAIDGAYVGSIYVPRIKEKSIIDLKIMDTKLIVLYKDGYCAIFTIADLTH